MQEKNKLASFNHKRDHLLKASFTQETEKTCASETNVTLWLISCAEEREEPELIFSEAVSLILNIIIEQDKCLTGETFLHIIMSRLSMKTSFYPTFHWDCSEQMWTHLVYVFVAVFSSFSKRLLKFSLAVSFEINVLRYFKHTFFWWIHSPDNKHIFTDKVFHQCAAQTRLYCVCWHVFY